MGNVVVDGAGDQYDNRMLQLITDKQADCEIVIDGTKENDIIDQLWTQ
jgi:hypothetical protein